MDATGVTQQDSGGSGGDPYDGPTRLAALVLNAFLKRMVLLVDATDAAGFAVERVGGRPVLRELAHLRAPEDDPNLRGAALSGFRKMVQRCLDSGKTQSAFGIDGAYTGGGMKFCLVSILSDAAGPRAAVAVVTRCKDRDDVRRRLGLLCGGT